jgi:hypothetical protein
VLRPAGLRIDLAARGSSCNTRVPPPQQQEDRAASAAGTSRSVSRISIARREAVAAMDAHVGPKR